MIPELSDIVIKNGDVVAVDLETHDPELKTHGSGAIINKGKVVGIALAYNDKKFYFPIRHSDKTSNLAPNLVWKVLNKKIFQNKNITKVFHNAMYDVCWIRQESKLMVQGPIVDTMIAASVIDENRQKYSLDSLAKDYLKDITVPTTILYSMDDPFVESDIFKPVRMSTSIEINTAEWGGHMGYLSRKPTPWGDHRWMDFIIVDWSGAERNHRKNF